MLELANIFENRCAYCESELSSQMHIDHFRPKSTYPQLYYSLENIYPVCVECNNSKGAKFPLKNEEQDFLSNKITVDLSTEITLLINPIEDNPEEHLRFNDDGSVSPLTENGEVTIRTLNLNRKSLISSRFYIIGFLKSRLKNEINENLITVIQDMNFKAIIRTIIFNKFELKEILKLNKSLKMKMLKALAFNNSLTDLEIEKIYFRYKKGYIEDALDLLDVEKSFEFIEEICLKSVKGISFNHKFEYKDKTPCLMILGENGVGKTTLLQAITYAITNIDPKKSNMRMINKGEVKTKLKLSDGSSINSEYIFSKKRNPSKFYIPIAAYGSVRIQAGKGVSNVYEKNILNLVGKNQKSYFLEDSSHWLTKDNLKIVQDILVEILPTDRNVALVYDDEKQKFKVIFDEVESLDFDELSSGYRTITNLVMDIARFLFSIPNNQALLTPAVILIDEIDVHLHPSWKIKIVELFRGIFPRIQFIMTTHDPLCLRGLKNNEIIVLKKGEELEVLSEEIPFQGDLKIEDLLLSDFFGLDSTLDAQHKLQLQEGLNASTDGQDAYKYYGYSLTEQIALKIIDEALDSRKITPNMKIKDVDQDIKESVLRLWNLND